MSFGFEKTKLDGACIISAFSVGDVRGGFTKFFEKDVFASAGIEFGLNEMFASRSARNVIRGLHFQTRHPQAKLVCVTSGKAWDVIVDLRMGSPTYKQWISVELSADSHTALYVPKGFAHGFTALEDDTVMLYLCDGAYDKSSDTGIRFDDPEIGITWPIDRDKAIHSSRDLTLMTLSEYERNPILMDK